MASQTSTTVTASPEICKNCHVRPVFVENGRVHDFCGRRCAATFQQKGAALKVKTSLSASGPLPPVAGAGAGAGVPSPIAQVGEATTPQALAQTTTPTGPATTAAPPAVGASPSGNPICALSGCRRKAYQGSPYCGQGHRKEAVVRGEVEACLFCTKLPKSSFNNKLSDFCSRKCGQDTIAHAPIILALDSKSSLYQDVANQFTTQWKHSHMRLPSVYKVWKIFNDKKINDRFFQYKNGVEQQSGIQGANCRRRWHGTSRMCKLGDDAHNGEFCQSPSCSICRIIQTSFQLTRVGQHTSYGRFGAGIYTSATSSKAYSYVRDHGGSPYKAMLLNDVVMGKTKKLTQSDTTLTKPPAGYDSVVGEPGGDLNYDEAIVYQNEAIRPLFLVLYA